MFVFQFYSNFDIWVSKNRYGLAASMFFFSNHYSGSETPFFFFSILELFGRRRGYCVIHVTINSYFVRLLWWLCLQHKGLKNELKNRKKAYKSWSHISITNTLLVHIYIFLYIYIYTGCPKKKTPFWSLITASDFEMQTFTSNHSKKEIFIFLMYCLDGFLKHIAS